MQGNGLIRKLISKFMASQTVKQIITTSILPNILRGKSIHAMKFGKKIT